MSDTFQPAPLIGEKIGSFASPEPGTIEFPSSIGDTLDWFDTSRMLGRAAARQGAEYGVVDESTGLLTPPEPNVPKAELSKEFRIPGKLEFNEDLPRSVAQSMYDAKRDEIAREDAMARRPSGVLPGAARMGASLVTGLLDPVNLAAGLVPGVEEAGLASVLGRAAGRTVAGAASGAVMQAPLVGFRYAMSKAEQSDYDAYSAMSDLAMGAGIGGVLHPLIGAVGDALTERFARSRAAAIVAKDPEVRLEALQVPVAQMLDDRPVEVGPTLDSAFARSTINDLTTWARRQDAIEQDLGDARRAMPFLDPGAGTEVSVAADRLHSLQLDAETLRQEVSGARERVLRSSMDPVTADRLDAVDAELETVVPARRRQALLQEREMLLSGRGDLDVRAGDLESARDQAQLAGLQRASERADAEVTAANDQLTRLQAEASQRAADAAQARGDSAQALRIQQIGADTRSQVLQALAARNIRRFAGRLGVDLAPGEADRAARDILASTLNEAPDQIKAALEHIASRSKTPSGEVNARAVTPEPISPAVATASNQMDRVLSDDPRLDRAIQDMRGPTEPESSAETQAPTLKDAGDESAEHEDFLRRADAAGALSDEDRAVLDGFADREQYWENQKQAYQQAAACIARGLTGG